MKKFLGYETEEEKQENCFPSLSYKERLMGFAFCFVIGLLIQFLSMGSILGVLGKPEKFALLYTFGNIFSICGTFFLMGPLAQFKKMIDPVRRNTSLVFVFSLIMTLICVYVIHAKILTLVFLIIQFGAYVWYCLSYIPWGREICSKCLKGSLTGIFV